MNTSKIDAVMADFRNELKDLGIEFDVKPVVKGRITYYDNNFTVTINSTSTAKVEKKESTLTQMPAPSSKCVKDVSTFDPFQRELYDNIAKSKLRAFERTVLINRVGTVIQHNNQEFIIIGMSSTRSNAGVVVEARNRQVHYKLPLELVMSLLAR